MKTEPLNITESFESASAYIGSWRQSAAAAKA
jgi:hypothetical protein